MPAGFLDYRCGLEGALLEKQVTLDKVRQPGGQFVVEEGLGGDREDLVDFFQSKLLGLSDEGKDHEPSDQIESRIKAESTSRGQDVLQAEIGQTEDAS